MQAIPPSIDHLAYPPMLFQPSQSFPSVDEFASPEVEARNNPATSLLSIALSYSTLPEQISDVSPKRSAAMSSCQSMQYQDWSQHSLPLPGQVIVSQKGNDSMIAC